MRTLEWVHGKLKIIDQLELPHKLKFLYLKTYQDVVKAIKDMNIRGAPAIGVAAAYGCVLAGKDLQKAAKALIASRPTAVNIQWAVNKMLQYNEEGKDLLVEANRMAEEDIAINKKMGAYGAKLIKSGMSILTHCNAGALATVDYGTAVGVIRAAHEQGKRIHVFTGETRPYLQGARLTAWELKQMGVDYHLITDNMVGHFMQRGEIDLVVTGADRVARNGDTANKIGTYSIAVLAKEHGIPFYIAVPFSTIDPKTKSGKDIKIEERDADEVVVVNGKRIAAKGTPVRYPAFDVTPAKYITGYITEKGILKSTSLL
ncbi:S-methyl-5-thioribose-1-phosphate isomerase [candidate division WOR-1 bacterium RIFOXYA12_FULL_43_27]|uniref:Methylthioribose-1-phosphate isomerase n=1 Tax=candidate division WOR-1 bacterium RIFOXYC2_FULL_46_14 TaxID=1802587 RepID=A0A1F4U5E4_UNCSA|nr:MAG: S-methyl-5-thioribose-1-phosphate isomerase [candidate division WOR-1 bacterium RIFOXYA12_FULL_43_27]OGC20252.1 MAG: S-methyl-5-thioribose-1-phosphate isomerase [candidate division WOR-1 bacterium RIFOXYB2_FULL_46_45]OGC32310.1 MAG: S-methyl-5-thioribose-1-phosphate isomerase [candidate division WOR-1 bacterium RIFOXYA2_FULL_46_56]OGC40099.1 MAG: S-methyl-5-thioribose-1-phosphate isomerase [candidate division WOR-1 bacterium RIFOXYC2_FULL_46_14]